MLQQYEFWLIVLAVLAVAGATVRWFMAKARGEDINEHDLLSQVRDRLVEVLLNASNLSEIEKKEGRQGVRAEIARIVIGYINDTEIFTDSEKQLIGTIPIEKVVQFIENKLIDLGILKPEEKEEA